MLKTYYKASIEDIHVGRRLHFSEDKTVLDVTIFNIRDIVSEIILSKENHKYYIKDLDREDIESYGFEFKKETSYEWGTLYPNTKATEVFEHYSIKFSHKRLCADDYTIVVCNRFFNGEMSLRVHEWDTRKVNTYTEVLFKRLKVKDKVQFKGLLKSIDFFNFNKH